MRREKQYVEYGVRGIDGKTYATKTRQSAAERVAWINAKAREIGVEQTAHIVQRHVVNVREDGPWERSVL